MVNGKEDTGSPGHEVAVEIHKTSSLDATNQIFIKGKVLMTIYLISYDILVRLKGIIRLVAPGCTGESAERNG